MKKYKLFDHTADLGMEFFGKDALALFTHAGRALFEVMVSRAGHPAQALHHYEFFLQGEDWADLMVNWLRELLFLFNGHRQLLHQLRITSLSPTELRAEVTTDDYLPARHRIEKEIKAVTYHQVAVEQNEDGWRARVVFDV
ncbi:MAG: archease [Desulfobacterales bacterium]|nr:archease [Desulfobacterales bacterium]